MTSPPRSLVEAWQLAGDDLGVEIEAPYVARDGELFVAHVKGFGSPQGTLVDWLGSERRSVHPGIEGAYVSRLNADAYSTYDRDRFCEMLNDWGWMADGQSAPAWYTGVAWTS